MTSFNTSSNAANPSVNLTANFDKAPVLDFKCLFTRDVLRKQKRWHDGRLKFHTFNKRVMVHDERSNFIGDLYRQEDGALEEGEELSLERSGVLVEVGEYMGQRDQDLNHLIYRRVKVREERMIAKSDQRSSAGFSSKIKPLKRNESNHLYSNAPSMLGQIKITQKDSPFNPLESRDLEYLPTGLFQGSKRHEQSAKRLKPNLMPSGNTNRAQNLTESSNLSSSLSASTKSSTYNPVRERALRLNPCRVTIDLTKGDGKQHSLNPGGEEAKESDKIEKSHQVKKTHSSSLKTKNGFASKLTGAHLMLSNPKIAHKNPLQDNSMKTHNDISIKNSENETSFPNGNNPFSKRPEEKTDDLGNQGFVSIATQSETTESTRLLKSAHCLSSTSGKRVKRQKLNPPSFRSSPPITCEVTLALEDNDNTKNDKSTGISVISPNRNLSKPTLRIKSRPPRKMMFLEKTLKRFPVSNDSRGFDLCLKNHSTQRNSTLITCQSEENESNSLQNSHGLWEDISSPNRNRINIEGNPVRELVNVKSDKHIELASDIFKDQQTNHSMFSSRNTVVQLSHFEERDLLGCNSTASCQKSPNNRVKDDCLKKQNARIKFKESKSSRFSAIKSSRTERESHEKNSSTAKIFERKQKINHLIPAKEHESENLTITGIHAGRNIPDPISKIDNICTSESSSKPINLNSCHLLSDFAPPDDESPDSLNSSGNNNDYHDKTDFTTNDRETFPHVKNSLALLCLNTGPFRPEPSNSKKIFNDQSAPSANTVDFCAEIPKAGSKILISNPATRGIPLQVITSNTADALNFAPLIDLSPSESLGGMEEITNDNNHLSALEPCATDSSFGPWSRESFDLLGITKPL